MPGRAGTKAELERELAAAREALAAAHDVLRAINEGQGDAQAVLGSRRTSARSSRCCSTC